MERRGPHRPRFAYHLEILGRAKASGTGTSDYVGPGRSVATGTQQAVTVVAFNRGTCHGRYMYRAVEWYFPSHGQRFSPHRYENICTGTCVPARS